MQIRNSKLEIQNYQRAGFTLIEVLVSLAVFSAATLVAGNIYISSVNLERRGIANRAVQDNANFLFELIGKEVRNGSIDYASYGGPIINPVSELRLLTRAGTGSLSIRYDSAQRKALLVKGAVVKELHGSEITVESMRFYVTPSTECTESSTSCTHQRVT